MADTTDYGRGDAVSRGTSNKDMLRAMQDDPLDRLRALAAIADSATAKVYRNVEINPRDALAMRACVEEIEAMRADADTHRRCAAYWWAEYYLAKGQNPPSPYSSDKAQDAAIREMVDDKLEVAQLRKKLAGARLALGELRERLDETEASHDDEEVAHSETLAMLERLRAEVASKDDLIRQLSERVAICSELLGKRAEKGA